ncbi:hypothetical protein HanIR_Chr12g0590641 [Helianthus annuus]|nr:hypothetical protein HanIR_Chr12g0590641 [Helianthus annuus]
MTDHQNNTGDNQNPTNPSPVGVNPSTSQPGHIGTSTQRGPSLTFGHDLSQYASVIPPGTNVHAWYDQQAALLTATYNRACAEAQIQAGPTPAPHTPADRILQYAGRAHSRPASRSRREDRGLSYCSVHTINDDDSTYGSHTRGPVHTRLGPYVENRQRSASRHGSGIQSRLGPQPYTEGYGRTDPDERTYCGDSHDTCSRPGGRNYVPPTHPRSTYLRAAKRPENQPYRPKAAAENSKFAPRIAHAHVTTTKFPFNVGKYSGSSDPDDHMNIFIGAGCNGQWDEPTWCNFFPQTLTGLARAWFDSLPVGSLASFEDFHAKLLAHFSQQ